MSLAVSPVHYVPHMLDVHHPHLHPHHPHHRLPSPPLAPTGETPLNLTKPRCLPGHHDPLGLLRSGVVLPGGDPAATSASMTLTCPAPPPAHSNHVRCSSLPLPLPPHPALQVAYPTAGPAAAQIQFIGGPFMGLGLGPGPMAAMPIASLPMASLIPQPMTSPAAAARQKADAETPGYLDKVTHRQGQIYQLHGAQLS